MEKTRPWHIVLLGIGSVLCCPPVLAKGSGFFKTHNLGVSYDVGTSYARIGYDAPSVPAMPNDCTPNERAAGKMRCEHYLAPDDAGGSPAVFLEAPFKRQGLFYFEPGFTIATISYEGNLQPVAPGKAKGSARIPSAQPLQLASMELYGINWQGYFTLGLTPRYLPDILVSVGGGVQTVGGTIKVFKEKYTRYIIQPDIFGKVEVVLMRAGTSALSVYIGLDQSIGSEFGSALIDDYPGGTELSTFRLALTAASSGVRLLLPF
jgi:hypothetical protein